MSEISSELFRGKTVCLFLHRGCSLLCPYCVSNASKIKPKKSIVDKIGMEKYAHNILKMIRGVRPVTIAFEGPGECPESKYFLPLAKTFFREGHDIQIQTHLQTSRIIESFLSAFERNKVEHRVTINASYHLGTYLDRGKKGEELREAWLDKHLPTVARYGCEVRVITPLTPAVLNDKQFENNLRYFKKLPNVTPKPIPLGHIYKSKHYPESYTSEQRKRVLYLLQKYNPDNWKQPSDPKHFDILSKLHLKKHNCHVASNIIQVLYEGGLRYCQSGKTFGNIAEIEKVDCPPFIKNPIQCKADTCHCSYMGYHYCMVPNFLSIDDYCNSM